jgi:DNA-binding transcriptional regulator YiaG
MTGAQLRQALRRLGVSQMELSRRLRVAPSTVRRWIANRTRIPEAVALLLKEWLAKR